MSQPSNFSDSLRDACQASGFHALQIAKDLDINRSTLQRFIRGDGDLKLSVADKLANYLGVTAEFDGGLAIIRPLIRPKKLWSWRELQTSKTHPPASPGVYAWWFREIPPRVPTWGTERYQRYRLLYAGISPMKPSVSTGKKSKQTVRDRLRYHFSGNIGGSTLRVSLASLLRQELKLRPVWTSYNSLHLRKGEERLSEWMARWARVCWIEYERPWELEDVAIRRLRLPLNIQGNDDEEFRPVLKESRARLVAWLRETELPYLRQENTSG